MRRLLVLPFILSFLLLSSFAQADQTVQELPAFNAIKTEGVFDVKIIVGGVQSVFFRGKDEKFNKLSVSVVDGELRIIDTPEKSGFSLFREGKFIIHVPSLNSFKGKGVGEVDIKHIAGEKIDITFEGVGSLEASGKVNSLRLKGVGVGEIDTKKLIAENVDVDFQGVGGAKIYASKQLNAAVHGVGELTYYGNPVSVTHLANGIGRIKADK